MSELVIKKEGAQAGLAVTYTYGLRASAAGSTGALEQEFPVSPSPALVRSLCEKISQIVLGSDGKDDAGAADALVDTCRRLHNTLFPRARDIPSLVRRVVGESSLLVRTNETLVPWELLHDGEDFLATRHDLGRLTFVSQTIEAGRTVGAVKRALIVGNPTGDLAEAGREAEHIAAWLQGHDTTCTNLIGQQATLLRVIEELDTGNYDLLHYSGHVAAPVGSEYVGLRLSGDELLDERALEPLSGSGVPPLVFINGCASAERLGSVCVSFMTKGARVAIGTRYEVREEPARLFAERFYAEFIAGATVGAAVRAARQTLRQDGRIDWASFVLYGDPAVAITSAPSTAASVVPARGAPADRGAPAGAIPGMAITLDLQARAVMDRVAKFGARDGMMMSHHLLAGLITTLEFKARIRRRSNRASVAELDDALTELLSIAAPAQPDAAGAWKEPEMSGTVRSVLAGAERLTQEAGRDYVTTDDIIDAYVAVGGGNSRQLLALADITLPDLRRLPVTAADGDDAAGPEGPGLAPSSPDTVQTGTTGHAAPRLSTVERDTEPPAGAGAVADLRLTPTVRVALVLAALTGARHDSAVGTDRLLAALAAVGSPALRRALAEQGEAGKSAYRALVQAMENGPVHLSPRTRRALRRAAQRSERVDDVAVLCELLVDRDSASREMLADLGVDADQLLRSLEETAEPG